MATVESRTEMITWQLPAKTPPWTPGFASIYCELVGSQTRFVKGRKYTTRVIEAGDGDPLILLHGMGGSAETWFRNVMPLSRHFHVCAIDALGYGFSSKESADPTLDGTGAQVDHLLDFMDAMGFERAHVVGESMGAHITFRIAYDHPERVQRIILNTGVPPVDWKREFPPNYKGDSLFVLNRIAMQDPNPSTVRKRMEWLMTTPDRVVDELVQLRLKMYSMEESKPATGGARVPQRRYAEEDLANIKAPTLVFWTEFNPSNRAEVGEHMAKLIPGAKFYLMRDAAHWPQYEHPEEHDRVVTTFLKTGELP
jgi:pimeloyl-ACP methyl ester carboxylesterase